MCVKYIYKLTATEFQFPCRQHTKYYNKNSKFLMKPQGKINFICLKILFWQYSSRHNWYWNTRVSTFKRK